MLDADFLNQLEQECAQKKILQEASPMRVELDSADLRAPADLRAGGTLARCLPNYQERRPQIEMASLVEWAIRNNQNIVTEAATGTGKSLSYLIPLIRTGKTGIISTANKALQEQLFYKDIPFAQRFIQPFSAVLVKGMANYLCLARMEKETTEVQSYAQDPAMSLLEESIEDPAFNGDFESLSYPVSPELRNRIGGDRDDCAGKKCPFRPDCYYYRMREEAKSANVIVTNHKLLMLDIHSGERVLPARDAVIIDEAHTLEGVATDTFKIEAKRKQIETLLRLKQLRAHTNPRTVQDAYSLANIVWDILEGHFKNPQITSVPLTAPLEDGLHLASAIEKLAGEMESSKPETLSEREGELYDRKVARTVRLASALRLVFSVESDRYVYCLRRAPKNDEITAEMVPLSVASILKDSLFSSGNAVVCTSATLATPGARNQPTLDYFCNSIGMDVVLEQTRILPLVFNYQQNALLYVPTADSVPDPAYGQTPEAARYEQALANQMLQLVRASRGRAFLLFSSRRILNAVAGQILPTLKQENFMPLIQGDKPPAELVRRFREGEQAILFGLRTFWEGVDIQGDALSLVAIDKLPFVPVDDPVLAAKERRMKAEGKSFFRAYSLPNAVLLLKQGVGRLIRSDRDRGVMAILDSRLWTAGYGSKILNCLPPARRINQLRDVERFYKENIS
jgi:Rad3-related DNA helicase